MSIIHAKHKQISFSKRNIQTNLITVQLQTPLTTLIVLSVVGIAGSTTVLCFILTKSIIGATASTVTLLLLLGTIGIIITSSASTFVIRIPTSLSTLGTNAFCSFLLTETIVFIVLFAVRWNALSSSNLYSNNDSMLYMAAPELTVVVLSLLLVLLACSAVFLGNGAYLIQNGVLVSIALSAPVLFLLTLYPVEVYTSVLGALMLNPTGLLLVSTHASHVALSVLFLLLLLEGNKGIRK